MKTFIYGCGMFFLGAGLAVAVHGDDGGWMLIGIASVILAVTTIWESRKEGGG